MCARAVISAIPSVPVAGQDADIEIVRVSDPSVLAPSDVSAIALDFKVLHPVVITKLGVFPSGTQPELQSNVTVKLLQLDQEVTEPPPLSILCAVRCASGGYTAWGKLEDSVLPVLFNRPVCGVVFTLGEGKFATRDLFFFFAGGCGHCPLQCHQHRDHGERAVVQTSGAVHFA